MALDRKPGPPSGKSTTRHLEGSIVETVFEGRTTAAMIGALQRDLRPHLLEIRGLRWLVDAAKLDGFENARNGEPQALLQELKDHDCAHIAVVVQSLPARMLASAISIAAPVPMKVFATRHEALEFLRSYTR